MDICEKLIATIGTNNVKTNNAVEAISRNDFYVLVRTAESEYKCQYVIVTTPPAQLLKINFYPPLNDAKATVFRRMHNKPCIKFIITYKRVITNFYKNFKDNRSWIKLPKDRIIFWYQILIYFMKRRNIKI